MVSYWATHYISIMKIIFSNLLPRFFTVTPGEASIWGNTVEWESGVSCQVQASSGSGKTTLVAFLAGLRGEYSGEIWANGQPLSSFTPNDWSRWRSQTVSFVYQDLRLFPQLTVLENCRLASELSGDPGYFNIDAVREQATVLGIADKLTKKLHTLSFGQMQRTAIIRALQRPYQWLVMDEPFSHLDIHNASIAWELIQRDAQSKGAGVMITSLDPVAFIQTDQTYII